MSNELKDIDIENHTYHLFDDIINTKIFNSKKKKITLICIKWVHGDPSTICLATTFTQKMPESTGSIYSSILMLENI